MLSADEKLTNICDQLKKGVAPPRETVRAFLLSFGAERRGYRVVRDIRASLAKFGLQTEPDFEYAYIDSPITFVKRAPSKPGAEEEISVLAGFDGDPTFRVGRLQSANKEPTIARPESTLAHVVTVMMTNDFSQLPIISGSREVKGIVSWKTIGSRLALGKSCSLARDCMEPAQIISIDESLFSAISVIAAHDYVLVKSNDQRISGIITASDFNEQFRKLAEPFLLVGEIENGIRRMLYGKFTVDELKQSCNPDDAGRCVEGVTDLTFGSYIYLIQEEKAWRKVRLEIDRKEFIDRLNRIRQIRNDVMHFDPDGLEDKDLSDLREFAQFLKRLRDIGVM
jgi:CBS domain-containing protein